MKLVKATADDLETLVERWYDLSKEIEAYSELNELASEDVLEVPDDGFRAHLSDEDVTDYSSFTTTRRPASLRSARVATRPASTRRTFVS